MRSALIASRSVSWTFARVVGSTRATSAFWPACTSRRISAPRGSTTSTVAWKEYCSGSADVARRTSSGRMPKVTPWPLSAFSWPAREGHRQAEAGRLGPEVTAGLRELHLDEVHRRRADEARDEAVGRLRVEVERLADLLD